MAIVAVVNIAVWPIQTAQTAFALPRQQIAGSLANTGSTLGMILATGEAISPTLFAVALLLGAFCQLGVQAVLLARSRCAVYSPRDWAKVATAGALVALVAAIQSRWETGGRILGVAIAGAGGIVMLYHYRAHSGRRGRRI
jgi:hypothetical protein